MLQENRGIRKQTIPVMDIRIQWVKYLTNMEVVTEVVLQIYVFCDGTVCWLINSWLMLQGSVVPSSSESVSTLKHQLTLYQSVWWNTQKDLNLKQKQFFSPLWKTCDTQLVYEPTEDISGNSINHAGWLLKGYSSVVVWNTKFINTVDVHIKMLTLCIICSITYYRTLYLIFIT